jgi:hypothetical protein
MRGHRVGRRIVKADLHGLQNGRSGAYRKRDKRAADPEITYPTSWTATATMMQLFEWNPVPPVASTPTISWRTLGLPPQNRIT